MHVCVPNQIIAKLLQKFETRGKCFVENIESHGGEVNNYRKAEEEILVVPQALNIAPLG